MFTNLPEEIERYIWKIYFSDTVMSQIKTKKTIWFQPSNKILKICKEVGCLQHGHSDLEKLLFDDFNEKKKLFINYVFKEFVITVNITDFPVQMLQFMEDLTKDYRNTGKFRNTSSNP